MYNLAFGKNIPKWFPFIELEFTSLKAGTDSMLNWNTDNFMMIITYKILGFWIISELALQCRKYSHSINQMLI